MADFPSCCAGMAHYSTNAPRVAGRTRFDDAECLIHLAADGNVGIIIHDDSGRFSIIKFCPWCGAGVGPTASALIRTLGFVEEPPFAQGHGLSPPHRSNKKQMSGPVKSKGKTEWTPEKRADQADRMRAMHERKRLERQRAALAEIAPSQDRGDSDPAV